MALEVNEIGIRMQVRDGKADAEKASAWQDDDGSGDNARAADRDDIVAECVRRVLRALKTSQER